MAEHRLKKWKTSNALRRLRLSRTMDGMRPASQYEVAKAINVGLDRYFQLEQGRSLATPRERQALAAFFHVPQRDLELAVLPTTRRRVKIRRAS